MYLFSNEFRRLDSNALVCDCKMLWLANMLKEQGMKNTVASCKYPKVLQGKSIISLSQSELKCSEFL